MELITLTCEATKTGTCDFRPILESYHDKIFGSTKNRPLFDTLQTNSFPMVLIWFVCDKNHRKSYAHKMGIKTIPDRHTENNIPIGTGDKGLFTATCKKRSVSFSNRKYIGQKSPIVMSSVFWPKLADKTNVLCLKNQLRFLRIVVNRP